MPSITVNLVPRNPDYQNDLCFVDIHTPKGKFIGTSDFKPNSHITLEDVYCRVFNEPLVKQDGTFSKSTSNEIASRVKTLVKVYEEAGVSFPTPSRVESVQSQCDLPVYQITVDTDTASMLYAIQSQVYLGFIEEDNITCTKGYASPQTEFYSCSNTHAIAVMENPYYVAE